MASYDEAFKTLLTGKEEKDLEKEKMNIPLKGSYAVMESTTIKKEPLSFDTTTKYKHGTSELKIY